MHMDFSLGQAQEKQASLLNSISYQRGNNAAFAPDRVEYNPNSLLNGKHIGFLGSSITYGFAAMGVSFVDYLSARDGVVTTKSAISGTTLAGKNHDNYLYRLKHNFNDKYDYFVCQLSTNDGRMGIPMGKITANEQRSDFDTETTLGAMEEICAYVHDVLKCPLAFYVCLRDDPTGEYEKLIDTLKQLQKKWHFDIIDLFHDQALNASIKAHPNSMYDDAHPTQEGYLKVWLPFFEKQLEEKLKL